MAAEISIRPAKSRQELETVLDVAFRVSGGPLPAVDELEHTLANDVGCTYLLGYWDGEPAASGVGKVSSLVGCLFAMVRVLPEFRGRRVGRAPDIPTEGGVEAWPFERWRSAVLDAPTALPEAAVVAVANGEVVGSAVLAALSDGGAEHGLTVVRRAWRGRGIATALKSAQIEWARRTGYKELHTSNDETNLSMRSINARLGYEAAPAFVMVRGPLAR
jgi:GNAT superfamily N-acetyltransferase